MSFVIEFPQTAAADFAASVDAAVESPAQESDEGKKLVELARESAKAFAAGFDGGKSIVGSAAGNACQEGTGVNDFVTVTVYEVVD